MILLLFCQRNGGKIMKKRYYATYKGLGITDIAIFKSKEERDRWVGFKDNYSLIMGTTRDNVIFERTVFLDKEVINYLDQLSNKEFVKDFNKNQLWFIRSYI